MKKTTGGRPPQIYEIIFIVFMLPTSLIGTWLSVTVVRALGFTFENDFIGAMWRMISLELFVVILPMAVAIEIMWDHWKNRSFHFLGVVASAVMVLEDVTILSVLGLAFEIVFPGLSLAHEHFLGLTGLALGLMVGLPMLVVVLTIRIPKIRECLKKAYG